MAAPKRQRSEKLAHQARIADLYLQGMQQAEIVEVLRDETGLDFTLPMVKRDLGQIRERWRNAAVRDYDEAIGEQLAKLDQIEREVWEQWRRSCETIVKNKSVNKKATQWPGVDKTVEKIEQTGDPRYMSILLSIVERRCRLLGLDKPLKVAPTDPTGTETYRGKSETELDKRIAELMDKLGITDLQALQHDGSR